MALFGEATKCCFWGIQFYTLFKKGLYFEITRKAYEYEIQILEAFVKKGCVGL